MQLNCFNSNPNTYSWSSNPDYEGFIITVFGTFFYFILPIFFVRETTPTSKINIPSCLYATSFEMYSWRVNGYYGVLMLLIKGKALADDKSDLPV